MTVGSEMNSITDPIRLEQPELFALEFGKKNLNFSLFYTLASANINQSAPNLVKIYMTNKSQMGSISCLI